MRRKASRPQSDGHWADDDYLPARDTIEVLERGTRPGLWSILDASGEPIPRTDLPTKQAFIGFYELKDRA